MAIETVEELCQLNVRCMPPELRDEFKMWCVERKYAMERAVVELIRLALLEHPDLPDAHGHHY